MNLFFRLCAKKSIASPKVITDGENSKKATRAVKKLPIEIVRLFKRATKTHKKTHRKHILGKILAPYGGGCAKIS